MDLFQIMMWTVGPLFVIAFILVVLALSKGFEFFEAKKEFRMWPCTLISFGAVVLFIIGLFSPQFKTVLWSVAVCLEVIALLLDVIKLKLWGLWAFVLQFYVSLMFPVTLFLMISSFNIGERKRG